MLPVTKIQKFSTQDGPGIRTTVFLKGCPLRCLWCHNPETQSVRPEFFYSPQFCLACGACAAVCTADVHDFSHGHQLIRSRCTHCMACTDACPSGALERCAQMMSGADIIAEVMKDSVFFGESGGLTLSGGEPLMHGRAVLPLLRAVREAGFTTAVETCGVFDPALLDELVPLTNLFLWDVKDTDPARHRANTGGDLHLVLDNLYRADALYAKTRLRCILLQGVNLNETHLSALADIYRRLQHCEGIELLPYHTYGDAKNHQLDRPSAAHPEWIPAREQLDFAADFLRQQGVPLCQ